MFLKDFSRTFLNFLENFFLLCSILTTLCNVYESRCDVLPQNIRIWKKEGNNLLKIVFLSAINVNLLTHAKLHMFLEIRYVNTSRKMLSKNEDFVSIFICRAFLRNNKQQKKEKDDVSYYKKCRYLLTLYTYLSSLCF